MSDEFILIKEVALKNNCPECFSNEGLRLAFKQRFIETKFYKSITGEIKHELACKKCNSTIYPVQWTDEIELVLDYQKKAFTPNKPSTHLKKLAWLVIILIAIINAAILFTIFYDKQL